MYKLECPYYPLARRRRYEKERTRSQFLGRLLGIYTSARDVAWLKTSFWSKLLRCREVGRAPTMSMDTLLIMPVVMLARNIDFENPTNILLARYESVFDAGYSSLAIQWAEHRVVLLPYFFRFIPFSSDVVQSCLWIVAIPRCRGIFCLKIQDSLIQEWQKSQSQKGAYYGRARPSVCAHKNQSTKF